MIRDVLVLGAGSAGLIAALSIKRKIPSLNVTVVRSKSIGIIGVGESTTPNFPRHVFEYLGIPRKRFYDRVRPTWKLGIKFLWGSRGRFDYTFAQQLDTQFQEFTKPTGFYCDESFENVSLFDGLMRQDKVFARQPNGAPDVHANHAFHIENRNFVNVMEDVAKEQGVAFVDGELDAVERGPAGVTAITLQDGRRLAADFFIDASGFRSELLGRALAEPFVSFGDSLFCDRAVVGGWERTDEPLEPYTTAETMPAGWEWKIDHEKLVNCGYVYCSGATSDDAAAADFTARHPKVKSPRVVQFRSGCYQRLWVENVVALGNSAGFVEPLESTALMILCSHTQTLIDLLRHTQLTPTPTIRDLFNDLTHQSWQDIRVFLAMHYKLNGLLDTPFWKQARADTNLERGDDLLDFYKANGPTGFCRYRMPQSQSDFGLEGYLVMMVGNSVPYENRYAVPEAERALWKRRQATVVAEAAKGMTAEEALSYVHHPGWRWNGDPT